jgi:hypothetical protein
MTHSQQKGKRYELKTAHYFTDNGIPAERRLEQWRSGGDDLVLPDRYNAWLSVECKDVAANSVGTWLDQCIASAGPRRLGLLIHHRRGNGQISNDFATLRAGHALELIRLADIALGHRPQLLKANR